MGASEPDTMVRDQPCGHVDPGSASLSVMQCTLGGFEELQSMKAEKRSILGLPPLPEDSIKVIRNMRAASPPASASDLIEQQQKRGRREHKVRVTEVPVTPEGPQGVCLQQHSPWRSRAAGNDL